MKPSVDKKSKLSSTAFKAFTTKGELISAISQDTDLTQAKVTQVLESLKTIIAKHIKAGAVFKLPGLLKITPATKKATAERPGRNPSTGKPMLISAKPERKTVRVSPLKDLKAMV